MSSEARQRELNSLGIFLKPGQHLIIPKQCQPACLCGGCKLCRHRVYQRKTNDKIKRGIPLRKYVSDKELERRILAKII